MHAFLIAISCVSIVLMIWPRPGVFQNYQQFLLIKSSITYILTRNILSTEFVSLQMYVQLVYD